MLSQIDRAELALKQRGYRELRVRHFGDLDLVQLGAPDLPRAADPGMSMRPCWPASRRLDISAAT